MKRFAKIGGIGLPLMVVASCIFSTRAVAQDPVTVPIVVAETAAPIIINAVKPKHKTTGLDKFEGFVMNANSAQITVRAKGNDDDQNVPAFGSRVRHDAENHRQR